MKLVKILVLAAVVAFIGAVVVLATVDIPIPQHEVTKEIPHDRFANN